MVLPGIQALFGFQLTVVFHPVFAEKLSKAEQNLHMTAILLLALAIVLVMTPAAYHRQTGPMKVSHDFIKISTRMLLASMVPLAISICIDFYLVGQVIYHGTLIPLLTTALFVTIIFFWFVMPRFHSLSRLHRVARKERLK